MDFAELVVSLAMETKKYTDGLGDAAKKTKSWAKDIGSTVGTFALGAATGGALLAAGAVAGIGEAALNMSGDVREATNSIQAELGLAKEDAEALGDVAVEVFKNNFAGSIQEAGAAVAEVRRQLGDLPDEEIQSATENAFRLSDVFDADINESLNAASALMDEFGLSEQQAFDFMAKGFQSGLNNSDDFLDSIREYSNLFGDAGFDADEFFSIMETGAETGVLGTDKIADAMKEFGIIMNEGTDDAKDAFSSLGLSYDDIAASVAAGDGTWADYFGEILSGLQDVEDPIERNRLQVALFGTMAEDLGASFTDGLSTATTALEDMEGAVDSLDVKYDNFGALFESVKRRALTALIPIGDKLLDLATEAMPFVESAFDWFEVSLPPLIDQTVMWFDWLVEQIKTNVVPFVQDTLIPAFMEFGDWLINEGIPAFIEFITPIMNQVIPGLMLIADLAMQLGAAILPILASAWAFVTDHLNIILPILAIVIAVIAAIQAPILLVIGAVVLLATAWANNWGGIQEKTQAVWDFIMPFINAGMTFIQKLVTNVLSFIQGWWADHGESVMTIIDFLWTNLKNNFKTSMAFIKNVILVVAAVISAFWDRWGDTIWQLAVLYWDNIKIVVSTVMDVIGFVIDAAAALIKGDWQAFGDALEGIWRSVWDAAKGILSNAKEAMFTILGQLAQDAKDIFFGIVTKFVEIGANLVAGIKEGVEDGWNDFVDWFTGKAEDLINDLLDVFGIGSPSKVFMEIGANIQEGLQKGIADNIGLPSQALQATANEIITNNYFTQNNYLNQLGSTDMEFQQMKARFAS